MRIQYAMRYYRPTSLCLTSIQAIAYHVNFCLEFMVSIFCSNQVLSSLMSDHVTYVTSFFSINKITL